MLKKFLSVLIVCATLVSLSAFANIPDSAKLNYNEGIDYYKLGMYERAIESFRSAIREYPDYMDAYYNLGSILEYLKNYSEAIEVFKQMYIRNPNDYEIVAKLASLYSKQGDYEVVERYANLIPSTSEYYNTVNKLKSDCIQKHTMPPQQHNPQSLIATQSGVYENILSPTGITTDRFGNVYVALFSDNSILKITPENKRTIFIKSKEIDGPISLASDSTGNIYVSNYNANNVVKISQNGIITVLVDKLSKPYGLHVNGNMLLISCQGSNSIYRKRISE